MTHRGFGVLAIILAVCVDNMPRVLLLLNLEKMDIYIWICFATLHAQLYSLTKPTSLTKGKWCTGCKCRASLPIEISDFKEAMISGLTESSTTIMMEMEQCMALCYVVPCPSPGRALSIVCCGVASSSHQVL